MAQLWFLFAGLCAGALIVFQSAVNVRMSATLGSPATTTLINFIVGALFLGLVLLLFGRLQGFSVAGNVPWWAWLGGVAGAVIVLGATYLVPHIGTANLVALLVSGQALTALAFDHFGWLGVPTFPLTVSRLLGVIMIAIGIFVMRR